jgi:hypothetical protein
VLCKIRFKVFYCRSTVHDPTKFAQCALDHDFVVMVWGYYSAVLFMQLPTVLVINDFKQTC